MTPRFDAVHVVNLDRRPDRMAGFQKALDGSGWPHNPPLRFAAIDGTLLPKPVGFSQQPGAWGCIQSHMTLWQQAIDQKRQNIFIFEDDCVFRPGFRDGLADFLADVPDDWDFIYLGGLHRFKTKEQVQKVSDRCYRAWGVTGTWAYAVAGRYLPALLRWFLDQPMHQMHHLDQMLCKHHIVHRPKVYIPHPWLCGMASGGSDICQRVYSGTSWWDWTPGEDAHPYIAIDLLARVDWKDGKQVGDGHFRMGFDQYDTPRQWRRVN